MKVENLKQADRMLESFVSNLQLNDDSTIYQICNEFRTKYDAINVCHRAKQEVEQLSINDKKEIIKSYYHKLRQSYDNLDNWKRNELKEAFKFNQVLYSLGPVNGLLNELEYYYNYHFVDEATALKQQVVYFRSKKSSILFNQIDHTITTVCDYLNPIITIEPFKYYKYFIDNIDFKERFSIKQHEVNKDTLNTLYIGLETIFQSDIKSKLYELQNSFSELQKAELNRILASTIELRGKLKNSCDEIPNEKLFNKKYLSLLSILDKGEKHLPIEYGIFIGTFEGDLVAQLLKSCENIIETLNELNTLEKVLPSQPIKTKTEILKEQLSKYGFFELEKVKTLSEQSKGSIIEKIAESGLPYAIAMFDYLQFISYLEKKHFDSKYKLNREVSKWFDSDKEGRAVKGNISSLLINTTENKNRYTAYKHKESVIKDYELLK